MAALITPAAADREGFIDVQAKPFKLIGSPGYPIDEERAPRR